MTEKIARLLELILPKIKGCKQILIVLIFITLITVMSTVFEKYLDYKIPQIIDNVIEHVDHQVRNTVVEVIDSTSTDYSNKINKALLYYPEIDMRIDAMLDKINVKLNSGKSAIGIYHDGTKSPANCPFLKFSVTNERINIGKLVINESMSLNQEVAFSRIAYYVDVMNKEGIFICDTIDQLKTISLPDYFYMKEVGVKSAVMIPLTYRGYPRGFMVVVSYDQFVKFSEHKDYLELMADLVLQEVFLKYYEN